MENDGRSDRKSGPEDRKEPEIIPPSRNDGESETRPAIYADILAQFNQYTDRPDLFLEVIERYDPGFIAKINSDARDFSKKTRLARFRFGRIQSYTALVVSSLAAITLLIVAVMLVIHVQAGFWTFVGLAFFFAVTQSGAKGFMAVIDAIKQLYPGNAADKN